jgi:hypothetical protein
VTAPDEAAAFPALAAIFSRKGRVIMGGERHP